MTSVESSSPRAFRSVNKAGDRKIRFRRVLAVIGLHIRVRIPRVGVLIAHAAVEQLNESHAVLHEPARHQALPAERFGDLVVQPVQLFGRLRLVVDVDRLRRAALHPVRQLVGRNPRGQLGVAGVLLHVELVQFPQQIEARALRLRRHAGDRLEIDDRIPRRAERRPLERRGHVPRAPVGRPADGAAAMVVDDDERGQAGALGPEAVRDPGTGGWEIPRGSVPTAFRSAPARGRWTCRTPNE